MYTGEFFSVGSAIQTILIFRGHRGRELVREGA